MIEQAAGELGRDGGLHVVEVGAPDVGLAPFLPDHRVTPLARRVQSGGQLPLPDKSVDLVAGLDVLEHIAPEDRAAFVADLARVAIHGVVLSFPAAQAEETERFVARMTGRITFSDHQRFGLPEPADIEAMIDRAGMGFERRPNGCLASWLGMTLLFAGMQSKRAKREIDAFFNERFYELENREPAYRYVYLCRFKDKP